MTPRGYHPPATRAALPVSIALGTAVAVALFTMMALVQMIGDVRAPKSELEEDLVAFNPPEIQQIEEEPPPPPEKKEPPPELETEPPQLSLDQLDIALNVGTGGSLAGDFSMPTIRASQEALGTEDFVDFSELDQIPRPLAGLDFPARLRRKKVQGRIVVRLKLDEQGHVLDVQLESSNLPDFNSYVLSALRDIPFSPPTKQGQPVKAEARLPIPIRIE